MPLRYRLPLGLLIALLGTPSWAAKKWTWIITCNLSLTPVRLRCG